jgi:hypothetical protein
MSDQDFIVGGSMIIGSYDDVNNANIHSNEILKSRGNKFLVEGYGTYTIDEEVRHPDGFQPVDDANGSDPNVYQDDEIPFPQVNWSALRSQAEASNTYFEDPIVIDPVSEGYTSFAEWATAAGAPEGVGASADKPLVVFAATTMEIVSDMILEGYGILASYNGNDSTTVGTEIHGNLIIQGGVDTNEDGTSANMLITSQGGVFINGTSDITASIYSAGTIDFNGDAEITGGLVARNVAVTSGNLTQLWIGLNSSYGIYYPPFIEVFGPRIAAWSEW